MVGCQSSCSLRLMLVPMAPRPSSSPCWLTWASPWPSGTASGHARCPRQCGCRPHPAAPPDRPRAGPVPSPGTRRPPRRAGRPAPRQACDCGRPVAPHQAATGRAPLPRRSCGSSAGTRSRTPPSAARGSSFVRTVVRARKVSGSTRGEVPCLESHGPRSSLRIWRDVNRTVGTSPEPGHGPENPTSGGLL